jgi:radical SAM superfamily enzyme YgiQ (UPF0313 family)
MKIQLVHCSNDSKYQNLKRGYDSFPPPIGLVVLSSYLKRKLNTKTINVEIFDGNVSDIQTIKNKLKGDYIGFSDWFTNHENSLLLAKAAKQRNPNAIIIFGGPNASNLGKRLLYNHKEIDYVVYGDGEEALLNIIKQSVLINTWSRNGESIVFSEKRTVAIEETVPFDFEDIYETDVIKYRNHDNELGLTPIPISSIRGCMKAITDGPCSYCAIPRFSKVNMMPPDLVWKQIIFLKQKYGVDYFLEAGDNFLNGDFHRKMLSQKPSNINVKFRIYTDFESLNYNEIDVLKELGVKEIYIGLENVAHYVVTKAYRGVDKEKVIDIISYLYNKEIDVFLPFLFGLPGESLSSLCENYDFAERLLSTNTSIKRLVFSLAIPLIGTRWFSDLENNQNVVNEYYKITGKNLAVDDLIEYEILSLLSIKYFTSVSFMEIYNVLKKPLKNNPRIVSFSTLEDYMFELVQKNKF